MSINWVEFVPISYLKSKATNTEGMVYSMVRTQSAGVFAWYIEERDWKEVKLRNARRIWVWYWAATLSQLATEWTTKPKECKFPCEVDEVLLLDVTEIIPISEKARLSINSVSVWKE